jgi:hypothetical protein
MAAIISVVKVGFLMSLRGGSGIVVVRLSPTGLFVLFCSFDVCFSSPSVVAQTAQGI